MATLMAAPASAQCTPDPTVAEGITNCPGVDANGIAVTTVNSTVNVPVNALVSASATPAITINAPASFNANNERVNVAGQVQGIGSAGITLANGTSSSSLIGTTANLTLTVAAGGSVIGTTAVSLTQSSGNSTGQAVASIDNAGSLSGTSGIALLATNPALGSFTSIINRSSGTIGAISGHVGTLDNAGLIDGVTRPALDRGTTPNGFTSSSPWTNSGTITSAASSATIATFQQATITNSGTIANSGAGTAISASGISLTNSATGVVRSSNGTVLSSSGAVSITNSGTITGNVVAAGVAGGGGSFVDTTNGAIYGNVSLGSGDDILVARYVGTPTLVTGINGAIDAGSGTNSIRIKTSQDTLINAPLSMPAGFQQLQLMPSGGTVLTLGSGFSAPGTIALVGDINATQGSVVNQANLAFTGQAFTSQTYSGISAFTNAGTINASAPSNIVAALALAGVGTFVNSGTINVIGKGISTSNNGTSTNTGTIIATGTAVEITYNQFTNQGTIRSTGGTAVTVFGGTSVSNSGRIEGAVAGLQTNASVTNTGTIVATTAGGTAVALDAYGTLINAAGGVVGNGNGSTAIAASVFNSTVVNAGTINGNVSLSGGFVGANQRYLSLDGGVLNGNLTLGPGGLLVTDIHNSGSGQFSGITGTVTAGSGAALRYLVTSNASSTVGAAGGFQDVSYQLSNNAILSLAGSNPTTQQLALAGVGTVNLNAALTATTAAAIFSTPVIAYPTATSNVTFTPNQLNIVSAGSISLTGTSNGSPAGAVYLTANDNFTNSGSITVTNRQSSQPVAAVFSGKAITNSGLMTLDGATGISNSVSLLNTGSIVQAANGTTSQGVSGVTTIDNRGTISVGGIAVQIPFSSGSVAPSLSNSGTIASTGGVAISAFSGKITNLAGGTITGTGGVAIQAANVSLSNAGTINGTVNLGYNGSSFSSSYVAAGGTVNGGLIFGTGSDLFLQKGAATGISGTIDGGAGRDIYGWSYDQSGTVALDTGISASFEDRLVQINGAGSLATITGSAPFAGTVYVDGTGTIDNRATLTGAVSTSLPTFASNAISGSGRLAAFINNGTLSGGISGSFGSLVNNQQLGSTSLSSGAAVSISSTSDLTFSNNGQILTSATRTGAAAILQGSSNVTASNAGTITGGLSIQSTFSAADQSRSAAVSNSGTISNGNSSIALGVAASATGNTGLVSISNTGGIIASGDSRATGISVALNGAAQSTTANISNSGVISAATRTTSTLPPGNSTGISLSSLQGSSANITNATSGIISATGPSSTAILASNVTVSLDNSGTITSDSGTAVRLGAMSDTVTLRTGSNVVGAIVGGGGTDTAILAGTLTEANSTQQAGQPFTGFASQQVASFTGFSALNVQSGYWTAPATNSSAFNTATISSAATLEDQNGASGLAGVTAPSIVDNGTLVVRSSSASAGSTFGSSIVTGTGNVLLTGAGKVTLDGTNSIALTPTVTIQGGTISSMTGTTTIDDGTTAIITGTQGGNFVTSATGTLQVGNGSTVGAFTGSLVDNGTLVVNRSDDYTFGGSLSGTGTINKLGIGKLTFGTNFTFTGVTNILAGSIKLSAPVAATTELDVEGTGQLDISGTTQTVAELAGVSTTASINIAGGSLTVNQATNTAFAGSLTGNGAFTKTGDGRLNITGTNNYTGPTTVSGGTLSINGSIVSPTTVVAGGTLGGTGILGNVAIASGGNYAPGNSIGTQTVVGNVVFAAGSTFIVEANAAGQADRVNATGTASLAGTVRVLPDATGTYANLTNYTILTAAGGVSGTFNNVSSSLAFLTPLLTYGSNTVTLTLARNDISFAAIANGANQASVAASIQSRGLGNPLYNYVLGQSAIGAQAAFTTLAGELHASVPTILLDEGQEVARVVRSRASTGGDGVGIWGQAMYGLVESRASTQTAFTQTDRRGGIAGIDIGHDGLRFGGAAGYLKSDIGVRGQASHADVDTKLISAYVGWNRDALTLDGGVAYSWHRIDARRSVNLGTLGGLQSAKYDANTAQVFGEAAYGIAIGHNATLSPFAGYSHLRSHRDAFAEIGTVAALTVDKSNRDLDIIHIGAKLAGTAPIGSATLFPRLSISYQRIWGNTLGIEHAAFAGTGQGFSVTGAATGKDALRVEAGSDVSVGHGFRLGGSGFGQTSNKLGEYGGRVSLSYNF